MSKNKVRKDNNKLDQKVADQSENSKLFNKENKVEGVGIRKPGSQSNSSGRHNNGRGGGK